jgi:hypothetical protein
MIPVLDNAVDLGLDRERMSDEDAGRQHATVNRILASFFGPPETRTEIQLLADEVGLGKTFVALATAYAVLDAMRSKRSEELPPELKKCFRAVVVVTPKGNAPLMEKWHREVEAFRTRCSSNKDATLWFQSRICRNPEDFVEALCRAHDLRRNPAKAPCVIVCQGDIFTRRIRDAGERLRFLTACLFRWWGNKLNREERYHMVRRAAEVRGFWTWGGLAQRVGKGEYEVNLWNFGEQEAYLASSQSVKSAWAPGLQTLYEQTPFTYSEVVKALDEYALTADGAYFFYDGSERAREGSPEPRGLLPYCKWVADRRGNAEVYFKGFKDRLLALYRQLIPGLLRNMKLDLPLVIADEAHHWRHAQRQDCRAFRQYLAPLARRLLLLTATPFQLHRDELLEVLATGDGMEPAIGADRVASLQSRRNQLAAAMSESEEAGQSFSREWGALAEQIARLSPNSSTTEPLLPAEEDARTQLIEKLWSELRAASGRKREAALQQVPGVLRPFFARAIHLQDTNRRLNHVMAPLIIRHRRQTEHRRYWVGREYPPDPNSQTTRPDRSQLHLAPGQPMPTRGELAQYLLMRVVAEISRGKHRTTLGMDLTGCYTTLWKSRDGIKAAETALLAGQPGLLTILKRITGYGQEDNLRDAEHPKVGTVVAEALKRWDLGEKSLIFCFRVPTAETLHRLLSKGVDLRLRSARKALFESRGTEIGKDFDSDKAMQQFRRSLTAREGSGVPLFLDRVLLGWLTTIGYDLPELTKGDILALADICARAIHKERMLFRDFDRPDRVFLNRAIEHVLARRLLSGTLDLSSFPSEQAVATRHLLEQIAGEDWVRVRYGNRQLATDQGADLDDGVQPSELIARTSLAAAYDLQRDPDPSVSQTVLDALQTSPLGNRKRVIDTLLSGPNLFLPLGDSLRLIDQKGYLRIDKMRKLIFGVTLQGDQWDWQQRAQVLDAVVRAFLREDILLRLPRDVFRGEDETWSESLLRGLHQVQSGGVQLEPVAGRVEEFLRELSEMGSEEREAHLRYAMNPRAESVVLVTGSSNVDRDAIFSGFNTPLLPDILVCTQVGQEGIDLHRHCRHVVHYDLGWNPAAIEQRTGRADRIGSKAARERKLALEANGDSHLSEDQLPGLDIAMPYLAGTYDERMFERLRTRAQVFDILTGGDPTADQESGSSWLNPDSEGEDDGASFVPLPRQMLDDLRVDLAVSSNFSSHHSQGSL